MAIKAKKAAKKSAAKTTAKIGKTAKAKVVKATKNTKPVKKTTAKAKPAKKAVSTKKVVKKMPVKSASRSSKNAKAANPKKVAKPAKKPTKAKAAVAAKAVKKPVKAVSKKILTKTPANNAKLGNSQKGKTAAKSVSSNAKTSKAMVKPAATKAVAKKPVKTGAPKLKIVKSTPAAKVTTKVAKVSYEHVTAGSLVGLDILPYQEIAGEEYMNERQHEHFRNILEKWKEQLLEEMDRTVHHLQDEAINLPDPNDRASQEEEFSLELRARDRERKLIKKIEEATQKIDEGEYGYCDSCGVEIGIRRLEARPTANLCIDCKTLDEIRERQMGG